MLPFLKNVFDWMIVSLDIWLHDYFPLKLVIHFWSSFTPRKNDLDEMVPFLFTNECYCFMSVPHISLLPLPTARKAVVLLLINLFLYQQIFNTIIIFFINTVNSFLFLNDKSSIVFCLFYILLFDNKHQN